MTEFLQMGGYAAYVWSAYGFTLIVLIVNVWAAYRHHADMLERVRREAGIQTPARQPTVRQIS